MFLWHKSRDSITYILFKPGNHFIEFSSCINLNVISFCISFLAEFRVKHIKTNTQINNCVSPKLRARLMRTMRVSFWISLVDHSVPLNFSIPGHCFIRKGHISKFCNLILSKLLLLLLEGNKQSRTSLVIIYCKVHNRGLL